MKTLVAALALVPGLALAAPATYQLDASHSTAGFAVKHLVISTVRGVFTKTSGAVKLDDDVTKSTVGSRGGPARSTSTRPISRAPRSTSASTRRRSTRSRPTATLT